MPFNGFPVEGLTFLRGLAKNNTREWFQERKAIFEGSVKAPMVELVNVLNGELARVAPEYVTDPQKAIYRIYRDVRFSDDKSPYKTHIAAVWTRRGLIKHASAGLYMSVSPKEIAAAGGIYMPGPEQLLAIRTHLASRHAEFRRLAQDRKLRALMGEMHDHKLARVPKGFPADHPAADLLREKRWLFYVQLDAKLAAGASLAAEIGKRFRALVPFLTFLNAPLISQRKKPAVGL